ncbi:hypothetical protein BC835DRAFT_1413684 [Cytidiella melzeri]|nr:hypothetical protein BC835DRAFT_1413684 [Cytidiella melzeri]
MSLYSYSNILAERCDVQSTPPSNSSLLAFTLLLAFLSGYYSRGVSKQFEVRGLPSYFSRINSLITQTVREQYQAFSELCDGMDNIDANLNDGSDTEEETDSGAETPKPVRQNATDYFGPTMTRRRNSDAAGMNEIDVCTSSSSLDQMVMKWTAGVVDNALPQGDMSGLRSPLILREMYEAFKGEVAHIMNA